MLRTEGPVGEDGSVNGDILLEYARKSAALPICWSPEMQGASNIRCAIQVLYRNSLFYVGHCDLEDRRTARVASAYLVLAQSFGSVDYWIITAGLL
jgi:hypothetical protein